MRFVLLAATAVLSLSAWDVIQAAEQKAGEPVVAVFSLDRPVTEAPTGEDFLFGSVGAETLKDLIARMKKARDDDEVKAVVFLLGSDYLGYGQIEEIRQRHGRDQDGRQGDPRPRRRALHAGLRACSPAASNRSAWCPTGMLMITGLRGEAPYVRGLLDMIGVTPDFMTCGDVQERRRDVHADRAQRAGRGR